MNERVEGQEMDSNYSTEEYRSHGSTASNSSLRFFVHPGFIKMEFMKIVEWKGNVRIWLGLYWTNWIEQVLNFWILVK